MVESINITLYHLSHFNYLR